MNVIFYNTNSPSNKLNKALTEIGSADCLLKDDTNMISPTIRLSAGYIATGVNYCFIPAFGRYYFLGDRAVLIGKLAEYSLTVDPLMSWRSTISSSKVIALRSTNKPNKLLPDTIPVLAKRNVIYKRLTGGIAASGKFGSDKVDESVPSILLTLINGNASEDTKITLVVRAVSGTTVSLSWSTDVISGSEYKVFRDGERVAETSAVIYIDTVPSAGAYQYFVTLDTYQSNTVEVEVT